MLRRLLIASGAAVPWDPSVLSPQIWLDDSSPITDVGGSASAWGNKGTASGSFTQNTAARRPLIVASGLNGRRTVRFDGADDFLSSTESPIRTVFAGASAAWLFAVVKRAATTSKISAILDARTGGGTASRFACYSGADVSGYENAGTLVARRLDADAAGVLRSPASVTSSWSMLYFSMEWSSGIGSISANGGALDSASLTSSGLSAASLPASVYVGSAATSYYSDNEVAALVSGSGVLPSSENVSRLFQWARDRFGL